SSDRRRFSEEIEMKRPHCRPLLVTIALAGLLGAAPVRADEGRIPIYQPTTINQAGTYFLSRDIRAVTGDGLVINVSFVTIDLNGRYIDVVDPTSMGIRIADGVDNIRIRNGRIRGGYSSVYYAALTTPTTLWVEKLDMSGTASYALSVNQTSYIEVTSCK